ncbi:MAG TPA: carboxypeptidase-like regulatory domain-containing protein [Terriglobia bacterium]|nr:carboxypeptidase-like regulatory domain-containing protein [Terriglobia bacterium]
MDLKKIYASLGLIVALFIVFGSGARDARGQAASTGAILGTVSDPTGAVVPDAEVTITEAATGATRVVKTDAAGFYDVEALHAAGNLYDVTVKKEGFKTYTSKGVKLDPSQRVSVNVRLEVGSTVSEVSVVAAAVRVDTTSGASAGTISGTEVQELQLNGRDFRGLALLVPGVNSTAITGSAVGGGALNGGGLTGETPISVNGLGREMNNYTTDGAYNMNTGNMINLNVVQPIDSIAEFRILKDNYSAKYGTAGGAAVMLATKSGTREFHGSAYDYLRNDTLDSRNFFSPQTPVLKQNIFGGSIGGPVYIPGHYNTDRTKTFFFVSEEFRRRHVGTVLRGAMIPAAMRGGDFTGSPTLGQGGLKLDSSSQGILAQLHPGVNCIPDSTHLNPDCFDPNAVAMMQRYWPLPNNPAGGFNNYINSGVEIFDGEDHTYRIDHNFSERFRLLARVSYENIRDNPPALTWGPNPAPTSTQTIKTTGFNNMLQFTADINPTTINQITWTQTDDKPRLQAQHIFMSDVPGLNIKLPFGIVDPAKRAPNISLSGGWAGIGNAGLPEIASDGEQVLSDDFTKVKGTHTIQAGTMFIWGIKRQDNFATPEGSFSFSGVHTNDPVADFLLGLDSSFSQNNTRLRGYFRYHQSESYIQDDWRVRPRLTLNLGVRAVYFSSDKMEGNGFSDFDPARYDPAQAPVVNPDGTLLVVGGVPVTKNGAPANLLNGVVYPAGFKGGAGVAGGTSGIPDGIFTTSVHFAPRVGFAWDVFGDGKTSLRGGYGIGYGRIPFAIYNVDLGNPPFQTGTTLLNGTMSDPAFGASSPPPTTQSMGTVGFPPGNEYKPVMVQTWSLTVERQVLSNGVFHLAYVGSGSRNVPGGIDRNFPLPVSAPSINNPDCLQPGQTIPAGGFNFDPCLNRGLVSSAITRPYLGWSSLNAGANSAAQYNGTANYHSLQAGFNYRATNSLTFTSAYTWGHSLTDVANRGFDARQTGNGAQNPYNFKAEYGSPGYDRRHIFTSGYVYNLPFLKSRNDFVGKALGNWTFSGITVIESGFILTPGMSTPTNGLASRPNCLGTVAGSKSLLQWFNTSAFAAPAFGFFGNCGTGLIHGPSENTWNWALYKTFPVGERLKAQFRAEFFNIWNHPSFANVSTNYGAGDFGQVTSALDPRIIEFALRLDF